MQNYKRIGLNTQNRQNPISEPEYDNFAFNFQNKPQNQQQYQQIPIQNFAIQNLNDQFSLPNCVVRPIKPKMDRISSANLSKKVIKNFQNVNSKDRKHSFKLGANKIPIQKAEISEQLLQNNFMNNSDFTSTQQKQKRQTFQNTKNQANKFFNQQFQNRDIQTATREKSNQFTNYNNNNKNNQYNGQNYQGDENSEQQQQNNYQNMQIFPDFQEIAEKQRARTACYKNNKQRQLLENYKNNRNTEQDINSINNGPQQINKVQIQNISNNNNSQYHEFYNHGNNNNNINNNNIYNHDQLQNSQNSQNHTTELLDQTNLFIADINLSQNQTYFQKQMKLYKVNESQKDFFINSQPNLKSVENIDSINLLAKNLAQSEISPQKQTENKNSDLKNENFHIIPQQQKLFFQSSDNQQINNSVSNLNQSNNIYNSNNQNDNENEKSQQEKQNDNQKIKVY